MSDSNLTHNTLVEECVGCGKSFDGKNGYIFNKRALIPEESFKVWRTICPHCDERNTIPYEPKKDYKSVVRPRIPKARHRPLGSSQKRVVRDKWADVPADISEKIAEANRLWEANNGKEEEILSETEETDIP